MLAVACVIVNRAKLKDARLADICLKPFQFSCWNETDPNKTKMEILTPDDMAYRQALIAVLKAIDLPPDDDLTRGSTHYHALFAIPWWAKSMEERATIYGHRFYREKETES